MSKEEYYSRMEKIEGKLRTDRCSFDEVHNLNIQQNYLKTQYIKTLEQENQQLKQWDKNKDTRNSRQRVANYELLKENKRLKEENIKLQMKYISVLDEIRERIEFFMEDGRGSLLELLEILDKVKE